MGKMKQYIIATLVTLVSFWGCKNETIISKIDNKYFLQTYSLEKDQKCYSVTPTDDLGYLVIGSQDEYSVSDENDIVILKVDKNGNVQWKNYILGDSFNIPFVAPQKDGSILISPNSIGSHLVKIDKNGKIIFNTYFEPISMFDYYSFPLQTNKDQIIFASSFERFSSTTIGDLHVFSNEGKFIHHRSIFNSTLSSDYNCLYKAEDTATFYFYGIQKASINSGNPKIFVAKQVNNSVKKQIKVDSDNLHNNNFVGFNAEIKHIITSDGSLLLYNTQLEPGDNFIGYIALVNSNLIKLWDTKLKIGTNGTFPKHVSICPDGNYLVCGYCKTNQSLTAQPFACKLNGTGQIIWNKIYSTVNSGEFNSGMQLPDGSFVFGGTTNGFGRGKNLNDIFILKTDKNGELK